MGEDDDNQDVRAKNGISGVRVERGEKGLEKARKRNG